MGEGRVRIGGTTITTTTTTTESDVPYAVTEYRYRVEGQFIGKGYSRWFAIAFSTVHYYYYYYYYYYSLMAPIISIFLWVQLGKPFWPKFHEPASQA